MTKFEYFSMARRLWRGFESVTRVRALVVGLFLALVIVLSSQAAAAHADACAPSGNMGRPHDRGSGTDLPQPYETSCE